MCDPDEFSVVSWTLLKLFSWVFSRIETKSRRYCFKFSVTKVTVFGHWENHFLEKNPQNSPGKIVPRVFPFLACHWFPKTTGFARLGLFCIMGPSPDIWWAEVGEIIPRMSEHTGYYCVLRGIPCLGFWSRPSYCIHIWFSLLLPRIPHSLNFVFFMHA